MGKIKVMLDALGRQKLIEEIARRIEQFKVTAPAILFLESCKPLAFLGAQMLWAAQPFLNPWSSRASELALLFEDPMGIEQLIERLEKMDDD